MKRSRDNELDNLDIEEERVIETMVDYIMMSMDNGMEIKRGKIRKDKL